MNSLNDTQFVLKFCSITNIFTYEYLNCLNILSISLFIFDIDIILFSE